MNKLTTPTIAHDNTHGGINNTPREMDDLINKLCQENGLIKKKIILAIGSTPAKYFSKIGFNGLSGPERENMRSLFATLSEKMDNFQFSDDHYADITKLREDLFIEKKRLAETIRRRKQYLSTDLEYKKRLEESEIKAIINELKRIAESIRSFDI